MDTQTELTYGKHFNNNDFGNWENDFFARFTSGEGRFTKTHNFAGEPDNIDTGVGSVGNPIYGARSAAYSHELEINYGDKRGKLTTAGAFDGSGEFDVNWSFDFLDNNICSANGSCVLKTLTCVPGNGVCNGGPDTGSIMASLSDEGFVSIGNIPLPNGKQSLAIKSYMATSSRAHITDFEVMKPQ